MKRTTVVLCVLFALGDVACSSDAGDATAESTTTTAVTATDSPRLNRGDRYVSIGSSLASGFGIENQTDCGRSDRSYAHLVADEFGLQLVDVSCGAAVIPNVIDTPQGDEPPQIDAVTPDTKLITVGLGGNDIGYNGTALNCGNPATVCTEPPTLDADAAALQGKVESMIAALKAKAPSATIVLVTYPREFATTNCPALSVTDDELALMQHMGALVEDSLVGGAANTGVLVADPYAVPGDHTVCAPEGQQWTAGAQATDGFAYHPTALGHQEMAELILAALQN